MLRRPSRPKAEAMRAKWRIVVSFTAVLATHELGSTYHSFSQYDNERKARRTAGRPKAMRGGRGRPARPARAGPMRQRRLAPHGLAIALCSPIQIFGATVVESLEA